MAFQPDIWIIERQPNILDAILVVIFELRLYYLRLATLRVGWIAAVRTKPDVRQIDFFDIEGGNDYAGGDVWYRRVWRAKCRQWLAVQGNFQSALGIGFNERF